MSARMRNCVKLVNDESLRRCRQKCSCPRCVQSVDISMPTSSSVSSVDAHGGAWKFSIICQMIAEKIKIDYRWLSIRCEAVVEEITAQIVSMCYSLFHCSTVYVASWCVSLMGVEVGSNVGSWYFPRNGWAKQQNSLVEELCRRLNEKDVPRACSAVGRRAGSNCSSLSSKSTPVGTNERLSRSVSSPSNYPLAKHQIRMFALQDPIGYQTIAQNLLLVHSETGRSSPTPLKQWNIIITPHSRWPT